LRTKALMPRSFMKLPGSAPSPMKPNLPRHPRLKRTGSPHATRVRISAARPRICACNRRAIFLLSPREHVRQHPFRMPRRDSGKARKRPSDSGRSKAGQSGAAAFRTTDGTDALLATKTFLEKSLGLDGTESWPLDAFGRERTREVACLESWASEKNLWLPPEKFRKRRRGGQEQILSAPELGIVRATMWPSLMRFRAMCWTAEGNWYHLT